MNGFDLINEDCMQALHGIRDVDLIITSPPYNLNKEYEDKKTLEEYLDNMTSIIKVLHDSLTENGSICWQVGNYIKDGENFPLDVYFYHIFKSLGMKLRNRIVWIFGHGLHCKKRFSGRFETILWFSNSDNYYFDLDPVRVPQKYPNKKYYKGPNKGKLSGNPLGKNPSDVWDITNVKNGHPEKTEHPCQFPEELVRRLVLSLSKEQSTVLDPFMGSGTTGVVALSEKRYFIGIEKDEAYFNIALERISNHAKN